MKVDEVVAATAHLSTPLAVVDIAQACDNIRGAAMTAATANLSLFPHVKSHKSIALAREQLAAGAAGLTCQTIGEAELMAELAPPELVIPVPPVGHGRVERIADLAREVRITTIVADEDTARHLDRAAESSRSVVGVFLELDTGYHRCGNDLATVFRLATAVSGYTRLRFEGVLTYEGHVYSHPDGVLDRAHDSYAQLESAAAGLESAGLSTPRLSVGASAARRATMDHHRLTDARWGSAALGDTTQVDVRSMTADECAYGVVATVIARPSRGGFVIDAGAKALSYTPSVDGTHFGQILAAGQVHRLDRLADEQGMCDELGEGLGVGERVVVVPTAHAASIDCFDRVQWVEEGAARSVRVDARGAR